MHAVPLLSCGGSKTPLHLADRRKNNNNTRAYERVMWHVRIWREKHQRCGPRVNFMNGSISGFQWTVFTATVRTKTIRCTWGLAQAVGCCSSSLRLAWIVSLFLHPVCRAAHCIFVLWRSNKWNIFTAGFAVVHRRPKWATPPPSSAFWPRLLASSAD